MSYSESPAIIGVGNALVDIVTRIDHDSLLDQLGFKEGSMNLVDSNTSNKISLLTDSFHKEQTSGGSAANTIHGLAHLGVSCGFLGKVGKDKLGNIFKEDLIRCGVTPILKEGNDSTGRAIALISPDSERTFATFLGAAIELTSQDLSFATFSKYQYLYLEGYLVQNHELILFCIKYARQNNLKIALDLASFNVVEENRDFLLEILENGIDIVFANEEEARAISLKEPEDALNMLGDLCSIAIVKIGRHGSLIKQGNEVTQVAAYGNQRIDTTGAGDLFAAGFLYGQVNQCSCQTCAEIGSILACYVIRYPGARIPDSEWSEIINLVQKKIQ